MAKQSQIYVEFLLKRNRLHQKDAYSHILILHQYPVNVFSSCHFCALGIHNLYSTADLTVPFRTQKLYFNVTRNIITLITFITKTTNFFIYNTTHNFRLTLSKVLHSSGEMIAR